MHRILKIALCFLLILGIHAVGWPSPGQANPAPDNALKRSPPFCLMGQEWPGFDLTTIDFFTAFLSFTVHTELELPGGLFTAGGGTPELGKFITQVDGQWVDMVQAGILTRGPLVVSGFTQCCEPPVGAVRDSWGTLKARYR